MTKSIFKSIAKGILIGTLFFLVPHILLSFLIFFLLFRLFMGRKMRQCKSDYRNAFMDKIRQMSDEEYTQFKSKQHSHC
jgi:hypothetical protein